MNKNQIIEKVCDNIENSLIKEKVEKLISYAIYDSFEEQKEVCSSDIKNKMLNVEYALHKASSVAQNYLDKNDNLKFIPNGVRYVKYLKDKVCVVFEQEPCCRNINFMGYDVATTYYLSLPYTVFNIQFSRINDFYTPTYAQCYWNDRPLNSLDQEVIMCGLSNVYSDGKICTGVHKFTGRHNIWDSLDDFIEFFWNSNFNLDLRDNLAIFGIEVLNQDNTDLCYRDWERMSRQDEFFYSDYTDTLRRRGHTNHIFIQDKYDSVIESIRELESPLKRCLSLVDMESSINHAAAKYSQGITSFLQSVVRDIYDDILEFNEYIIEEEASKRAKDYIEKHESEIISRLNSKKNTHQDNNYKYNKSNPYNYCDDIDYTSGLLSPKRKYPEDDM